MSLPFNFEYHPVDENGFILPKELLVIREFANTDCIIISKLLGLPWYKPKARNASWPDSIAARLNLVPYTRIEMFRRSKEWHTVVDNFDFSPYCNNPELSKKKMILCSKGRKPRTHDILLK